jgi:hypothetical protein
LPLGALDFWSEQPLIGDGATAEVAGHDLAYRRPVEKVVEDGSRIDVQRWTVVAAIAAGRGKNLDTVGQARISHRPLQNWHQSPAAALRAVRSEAQMNPILPLS